MHIDSVLFSFKTKGGYIYETNLQTEHKLYGIDALCLWDSCRRSEERDYHDDPNECIHYLLNGTWKLSDKGDAGFVRRTERQASIFDFL